MEFTAAFSEDPLSITGKPTAVVFGDVTTWIRDPVPSYYDDLWKGYARWITPRLEHSMADRVVSLWKQYNADEGRQFT